MKRPWLKSKHKYSCASAIYFNLEADIKENCEFDFYYNKTDITPSVLDGGKQIILANWPSYKKIICAQNNNIQSIYQAIHISCWKETYYVDAILKLKTISY